MEILLIAVAYVVILIGLGVMCLWVKERISDALWRLRNPPEKQQADRQALEQRLLHPDWDFYERHLQRAVPAGLRELYANHELLRMGGCVVFCDEDGVEIDITSFEPLDQQGLKDALLWELNVVPFASSEGDLIYIRPGVSEPDKVMITYHDASEDDTSELASDVETFVNRLRWTQKNGT